MLQQIVHGYLHHHHRDLVKERRHADGYYPGGVLPADTQVLCLQSHRLITRNAHYRNRSGDHLPDNCRPGGAAHFPVKSEDEQRVQDGVYPGAQEIAHHRHFRVSVGADKVTAAGRDYHERESQGSYSDVFLRQGKHFRRGAEQLQQRRQEYLRHNQQDCSAYQHHHCCIADEIRRLFALSPAHVQVEAACAADSEQKRQGQAGSRKRERYIRRRIAQLPHGMPDEQLVHYVVERSHQHCNNARHRKFYHQGGYRSAAEKLRTVIVLVFHFITS